MKICAWNLVDCTNSTMPLAPILSNLIDGASNSVMLLPIAIVLGTFVFEDLTTVIVGLLAAEGIVPIPEAIISIYIGIVLGDTALYSLGYFARTHPRLAHYIDHDLTASFYEWLKKRYSLTIFSSHFVPGLRFTTYIASGFFRFPLSRFVPMAIAGGLFLGTTLFSLSYWFGNATSKWIGSVRWGIAVVFLLSLFFIAKRNVAAYRARKNELENGGGI